MNSKPHKCRVCGLPDCDCLRNLLECDGCSVCLDADLPEHSCGCGFVTDDSGEFYEHLFDRHGVAWSLHMYER
ncbi:MAG: hypothetical protein ACK4S4_15540 [Pyrinomonadaceae bacterium]